MLADPIGMKPATAHGAHHITRAAFSSTMFLCSKTAVAGGCCFDTDFAGAAFAVRGDSVFAPPGFGYFFHGHNRFAPPAVRVWIQLRMNLLRLTPARRAASVNCFFSSFES